MANIPRQPIYTNRWSQRWQPLDWKSQSLGLTEIPPVEPEELQPPVYDYPLPPRPDPVQSNVYGTPLTLTSGSLPVPFSQLFWPEVWPDYLGQRYSTRAESYSTPITLFPTGVVVDTEHKPPVYDYPMVPDRPYYDLSSSYSTPYTLIAVAVVQPPFKQLDWANPREYRSNPDFTSGTEIWLIGKDFLPFRQRDWPVPKGYQPTAGWSFFNVPTTLAPVAPPFFETQWDNPRGYARSVDLLTSINASLAAFAKPFLQTDWPIPRGYPPVKDWTQSTKIQLIGQDFLPFRQSEWPVPKGYQPTAGWTFSNIAISTAFVQPPFYETQWDNPRGYQQSVKDWIWDTPTQLIGQDALPFRQREWPVPAGYAPLNRGWENFLRLVTTARPFAQTEWPNPSGPTRSLDVTGWFVERISVVAPPASFIQNHQTDWPVPRGPAPLLRDWFQNTQTQLIGKDFLPFRQRDWVNPRGYPFTAGWTYGSTALTLPVITVQPPFYQTQWDNPRGYSQPVRDWSYNTQSQLTPAVVQNPFHQTNWQNPTGPARSLDLLGWQVERVSIVIPPAIKPFKQNDWPVPYGRIPEIDLKTFTDPTNIWLIGKDKLPFRWLENPNPNLGKAHPSTNRTFSVYRQITPLIFTPAYSFGYITG